MINKNVEKKNSKKTVHFKIIILTLILILGVGLGYLFRYLTENTNDIFTDQDSQNFSEIRAKGYQFTNPLLDCDNFRPSTIKELVFLKKNLYDYINNALLANDADSISVYFRSLNNGPWIGINEDYCYIPASLLKVPLLIALLKKAETDNSILEQKIRYDAPAENSYVQNIVDNGSIKIGETYTVEELSEYMIIHSDNNAKKIILELVGPEFFMNVMLDLGVDLYYRNILSVKEYSSFYRILYNASYLNRNMSERALSLLSQTKFKKGIPNKLPNDLIISHKFGERGFSDSNLKQLHDCGIIYSPELPYLLCIMTKGTDFDKLTKIISDISEMVYNSVKKK